MPVTFHTENSSFNLKSKLLHKKWIKHWLDLHNRECGKLDYIFVSNPHIRKINQRFLNHDHYTDVITFEYGDVNLISGDIFISIDQVRINARIYKTGEEEELRRVMIHGVNHLLGFGDGNEEEQKIMRQKENEALHLWLKMV